MIKNERKKPRVYFYSFMFITFKIVHTLKCSYYTQTYYEYMRKQHLVSLCFFRICRVCVVTACNFATSSARLIHPKLYAQNSQAKVANQLTLSTLYNQPQPADICLLHYIVCTFDALRQVWYYYMH